VHAVVRLYANSDLADQLVPRKDEVTSLVSGASGFRAYYLIRAGNDSISVTVCDDESGTRESSELAANWVRENMPDLGVTPPRSRLARLSSRRPRRPAVSRSPGRSASSVRRSGREGSWDDRVERPGFTTVATILVFCDRLD